MAGIQKGVCKNYDSCDKADRKEVQEKKSGEQFVCEECGKKLVEIAQGKKSSPQKTIIIAIAAVLLLGGGGFGVYCFKDKIFVKHTEKSKVGQDSITTPLPEPEDGEDETSGTGVKVENDTTTTPKPLPPPPPFETLDLGYATYEGPQHSGKAHGAGGKLTFRKKHTIDLKKMPAEHVEVGPGDYINDTKFDNGRLIQGELRRTDGTRKFIHIG